MVRDREVAFMSLIITADRWLHRLMRGRCYNRRICERLSRYEAMRDARRNHGTFHR
jgi:hypothetical protein